MICTPWRNGLRDCGKRMAKKCYCGLATKQGRAVLELRDDCGNWEWSAPSMTPTRTGDGVKTDKRDARKLARLLRAGELTAVYIPETTDETMRDLCRARSDAVDDRRRSRHRLKGFLLRHGYRYQGKKRLERSARALLARTGAAPSGDESDPGRISPGNRSGW